MSIARYKPGPRRTSCLTCRQRRKKCDLSKPCCERCLKGGFKCLGYGNGEHPQQEPSPPIPSRSSFVRPAVSAREASLGTLGTASTGSPREFQVSNGTDMDCGSRPSILETAILYSMAGPIYTTYDGQSIMDPVEDLDCAWPQDQNLLATHCSLSTCRASMNLNVFNAPSDTQPTNSYLSQIIHTLGQSIPPAVNATQMMREEYLECITYEYQLQRVSYWFMPPPVAIRDSLMAWIKKSKVTIWTMSLGIKLLRALSEEPRSTALQACIGWIDKLERKFTTDTRGNLPLDDMADLLFAHLELAYFKFVTIDNISGYILLQKALPSFLQLVAADKSLYMEHPTGNLVVSFPHALSSPHYELKRFVMYDTAAALVLGVPPLIEYGYKGECDSETHGLEWIHGVPVALVQAISQVNSWRAGPNVTYLDDWRVLEKSVLDWEPQPVKPDGEDSATGSMARLAVQESWRHVVLIYIYMGMCGVSSHDPRVQASIRQLVNIGGTVADLPIGIHMFTPCLVAGIGARLEKHRYFIREKLLSFKGTRVWLFRGPQFSRVLDHLWHGAGAGGAPVMWDDYVRSRRKKCDLARPSCERCLKGGFECLGYEEIKPRAKARRENPIAPIPSRLQPTAPAVPVEAEILETLDSAAAELSESWQDPTDIYADHDPRPSILGAALRYRISGSNSSANDDQASTGSSKDFNHSWPQEQSQLTAYSRPQVRQSSHTRRDSETTPRARVSSNDLNGVIRSICQSIPRSVDARQKMREDHFYSVLYEYEFQRMSHWFSTPSPAVHDSLIAQLSGSKKMMWTLYLGARVLKTLSQDSSVAIARGYVGWIDRYDQQITTTPRNLPLNDIAELLMVQLELAYLKFATVDTASGYISLQKALPRFLQLVATDTNLFMEHSNGNLVVSFSRTLYAPRYELERFIIYDTAASLILGAPPLVEYGYDGECNSPSQLEWTHGIPVALVEPISQVNSWRAGSRVPLDDWQTLEGRVLAWQSPFAPTDDAPVLEGVNTTRFAVQECWRHVVLIYIYMGRCGVSSHDPRVQASVHRIFQLGETVASVPVGIHMFTHCVIAGLAARLEKHRVLIHRMLLSFKDSRAWLFRGPQFCQVLYNLWHGVGVGGAPVTWDDYVESRCAIVPV